MKGIIISNKKPEENINNVYKIFNFINLNTLFWFKKSSYYRKVILKSENINFIDSRIISLLKNINQNRGPTFTKEFLLLKQNNKKKHFFIGNINKEDIIKISKLTKIPQKNISFFKTSFVKGLNFSKKEQSQIIKEIKKFDPDFIWNCIGSPKQEILSNKLYEPYKKNYFNVGAALDFFLEKKKEAPKFISRIGLEWFYRLITDFNNSKIKVLRSFVGLFYLILGKIKLKIK
jgi:exopolysaccharide biosynthesis WecB/TagA/CpsF family protein